MDIDIDIDPTRLNLGLTLDAETHETGPNINI